MEPLRLRLVELTVDGDGLPPASVRFAPGLNLIVGASDTGKTFIFESLDFMLGAKDGLRRIPESKGYDRVLLSIDPTDRPPFTLRRAFEGGQFEVTEYADGRDQSSTQIKKLSAQHSADPDASLSAFLLSAIGLVGREVRKNDKGEKTALSFRDVAHLTLIDEETIIQQKSPVLTGQFTQKTREQNVFAFFLTNQDDSQIIPEESRKERNARLDVEESTIESILDEKRSELAALSSDPDHIQDQVARLEQNIAEVSQAIITTQEEIATLEQQRSELFGRTTEAASRINFLTEQLKRLRLLDLYYESDRDRLRAVVEASRIYHELPEGTCPLCSRPLSTAERNGSPHHNFEIACVKEIQKIDVLQADLQLAITDSSREESELRGGLKQLGAGLQKIDSQLRNVLTPRINSVRSELQGLIQKRTTLAQGETVRAMTQSLEERLERINLARSAPIARTSFENRASTSIAFEFCKVVEDILKAWKFPNLDSVSFDTDKGDLVIGGQDRANKGKGYRAITYAAFVIGIMKYCRMKAIPHPGFVVLDTPMNPFRGPDTSSEDKEDKVSQDVNSAFYEYLANDNSGDQVIIMENEEPPDSIRTRVNYYHFSGNPLVNRAGFFPIVEPKQPKPHNSRFDNA